MNRRSVRLSLVAAAALLGTCFQLGGCTPAGILHYAGNFNPCGTILNCDPVQYNFATSGYEGPGVDAGIDPYCTFPPYCADDPFVGTPQGQ